MRKIDKLYPPGYPLKEELTALAWFVGLAFCFSLRYLFRLSRMVRALYIYKGPERFVRPDAVAESFSELTRGSFIFFLAPLLFLAIMSVGHYVYYWRQTKSIYVMRRIPRRGVVFASCIKGTVFGALGVMLGVALLYGLYLGLYFLVVPAQCLPRMI